VSVEAISWALNLAPVPADRGGQPSSACKYLLTELPVVFSQFKGQADGCAPWFLVMAGCEGQPWDVATLVVPAAGSLLGNGWGDP
jgi:hypothetical protein